ncbi:hypothetical protein D3C77_552440 [compost metagenome]
MPQMCSSPMLLPQAGMPEALMPCLMIQNAAAGSPLIPLLLRSGGDGYSAWLSSVFFTPGARWQPMHMAL